MDFPLSIKTYLESKISQGPDAWECISETGAVGGRGIGGWPHQGGSTIRLACVLL